MAGGQTNKITVDEVRAAIGGAGKALTVDPIGNLIISPSVRRPSLTRDPEHPAPGRVRKVTLTWIDGAGNEHERQWFGLSANAISHAHLTASICGPGARSAFLTGLALAVMMDGGR